MVTMSGTANFVPVGKKRVEKAVKRAGLCSQELLRLQSVQKVIETLSAQKSKEIDDGQCGKLKTISLGLKSYTFVFLRIIHDCWQWMTRKFDILGKPSKSNLLGLILLILTLVFYCELHTAKGFTKFWLHSLDHQDLTDVEVSAKVFHITF